MKKIKMLVLAFAAVLALGLLAGCGCGTPAEDETSTSAKDTTRGTDTTTAAPTTTAHQAVTPTDGGVIDDIVDGAEDIGDDIIGNTNAATNGSGGAMGTDSGNTR